MADALTDEPPPGLNCLADGGEMGAFMRAFDWSASALGPVSDWPQALRIAVSICLNSRFPLLIWWGSDLRMLYNDAQRQLIASKHPIYFARPGHECWAGIWDMIGPMLRDVFETGKPTWSDDQFLIVDRNGYPEETYFTFSYSPIRAESGEVVGIFTPVAETTEKIIGARRLQTLRDLAARGTEARGVDAAFRIAMQTLAANPHDVPFALVYLVDEGRTQARLAATAGIETDTAASPRLVDLSGPSAWPLGRAAVGGRTVPVERLGENFPDLPGGIRGTPAHSALVLPITPRGRDLPAALLVAAVSPHRVLDQEYESFFEMVAGQIATSLADAIDREREKHAEGERERLIKALDVERSLLSSLFMKAPAFIATLRGPDHVFEMCNPAYLRLVGYRDLLGKSIREALPEIVGQGYIDLLDGVYQTGEPFVGNEMRAMLRNNSGSPPLEYYINLVYQPLFDAEGAVSGIFIHGVDVTEQVVAWRRVEAADKAKDQFLAALSHELRTPLTPVLAAVTAMLEDPDTPVEVIPALEMTRHNIGLEARLIDDLLDITRITRGTLSLHRESVDIHDLTRRAVEICRDEIVAGGRHLTLDLSARSRHVHGDPARLQQVVWNLVKNAAKFTPHGGELTVRTRNDAGPDDETVLVEVSDTGIGIAPDVLPKVFNAFEQGDPTVTRQFGGLGLGLAISRSIADAHGGSLTASSPGRGLGATFTLTLPTAPAPSSETRGETPSTNAPPAPQPLNILLVEDNADTLRVMSRLLTKKGHRVTAVSSVISAIEAAERERFDLLVSDIGLPDGSGLDVMRAIRTRTPTKGIAFSGYGMDDDIRKSEEAGFFAHLTKPVDFSRLDAMIRLAVSAERDGPYG